MVRHSSLRIHSKWYRVALAETNGDMMDEIAKWGGNPDDDLAVQHLPPHVRAGGLTKGVHEDYAKVVRAIGVVLRKRGILCVPTPAAVYAEIPDLQWKRNRFLEKGGRLEHALDYLVQTAMEQSPLGDGYWDSVQDGCADDGFAEAIAYLAMPKCANDLEFAMVGQRLNVPTNLKHLRVGCSFGGAGVHREDEEEDEDVIQEDDGEDDFEEDDGDSEGDEEEGDDEDDDESMDEDDE